MRSLFLIALLVSSSAFSQTIKIGELNSYKVFPAFLEPYKKGWELAVEEAAVDADRVAAHDRGVGADAGASFDESALIVGARVARELAAGGEHVREHHARAAEHVVF